MKNKMATKDRTLVAIALCIKELTNMSIKKKSISFLQVVIYKKPGTDGNYMP